MFIPLPFFFQFLPFLLHNADPLHALYYLLFHSIVVFFVSFCFGPRCFSLFLKCLQNFTSLCFPLFHSGVFHTAFSCVLFYCISFCFAPILLKLILPSVSLLNFILLCFILLNFILLCFILLNFILLCFILLNFRLHLF